MTHIYIDLAEGIRRKKSLALAVILETAGSAPQAAGAAALFSAGRLVAGTIGGGLLEAHIFQHAALTLRKGKGKRVPEIVAFSLKGTDVAGREPICGGEVRVLVDPCPEKDRAVFMEMAGSLGQGSAGVLATSIVGKSSGGIGLIRNWIPAEAISKRDKEIKAVLEAGRPRFAKIRPSVFLEPVFPPARLVIVGTGHIGKAVARLGRLLDFEVTVIDDRREFANRKNVPDADHVVCAEIGPAVNMTRMDANTHVVIVTRGHEKDTEALRACVNSEAGYIGMIGSRSKIAIQRREFIARKWATGRAFDSVHAPIGIPIRSETVAEIAVSIAAELVLARSRNREKKRAAR